MTDLKPLAADEIAEFKDWLTNELGPYTDRPVVTGSMALRLIDMIERRDAWQPIETAPRGEHLLLVYDGGAVSNSPGIRLWRSRGSDLNQFTCAGITRWQPLPSPPSEALAAMEPK